MSEAKFSRLKEKALKDNNITLLHETCVTFAEFYKEQSKYHLAIEEYEEAAEIKKNANQRLDFALIHREIGEIYCIHIADFVKALEHQQIYLDIAIGENNELEVQRAWATIGRTHYTEAIINPDKIDHEKLKSAEEAYNISVEICENLTNISKREKNDIRARLLLNIGNVYENRGNVEKAEKFLQQSIKVCKNEVLNETLQMAHFNLGLLYAKHRNYADSILQLKNSYDLAFKFTSCNRIVKMCDILSTQAEVYVKLSTFPAAKQALLRAHKLRHPNIEDRENIDLNLKFVASLCYTEKELLATDSVEYAKKKELYEKMGDVCCELGAYENAIGYYKQMLENARILQNKKDIAAALVSVAQTYKDTKQHEQALTYFQQELELWTDNPTESVESLLNIAETLKLAHRQYEEIAEYYERARAEARNMNSAKMEYKVLTKFIQLQRKTRNEQLAERLETEKERLSVGSDTESEDSDKPEKIVDDIDISNITDDSASSEQEEFVENRSIRKRVRTKKLKNQKGETPLHLACIDGNVDQVKLLLDQGYKINERDFCGWLPLHEASNYGYRDIVEILLDRGAEINDRGGAKCYGITALHDAAGNGHLEVMELLLDRGASSIVKCDNGKTALDYLLQWRDRNKDLDVDTEELCAKIIERLTNSFRSAGKVPEVNNSINSESVTMSSRSCIRRSPRGKLNRSIIRESSDEDVVLSPKSTNMRRMLFSRKRSATNIDLDTPESTSTSSATVEYKSVMDLLRRRQSETSTSRKSPKTKTPLISSEELVDDDWLIDDLPERKNKRRKTCELDISIEQDDQRTIRSVKRTSFDKQPIYDISDGDLNVPSPSKMSASTERIERRHVRKIQTSLVSAGFQRKPSSDSLKSSDSFSDRCTPDCQSVTATTQLADSTTVTNFSTQISPCSLITVNVHIEKTIWKIPIVTKKIPELTIEWLAKEAARRYYSKEGVTPILQLETKESAILDNMDPLEMITPYSELYSTVLSWDLPTLTQRYVDACKNTSVVPRIRDSLEASRITSSLNLSYAEYGHDDLAPVFKALKHQHTLEELYLQGNCIEDDTLKVLCEILPTLKALRTLDISENCITWGGLSYIAELIQNAADPILSYLSELNFSYNSLGNKSLGPLSAITKGLSLRSLNIASCAISTKLPIYDATVFNLGQLECLNLSDNQLSQSIVRLFTRELSCECIKRINLAGSTKIEGGAAKELIDLLKSNRPYNLVEINLSRCMVTDYELKQLATILQEVDKFEVLNLSNNYQLTSVSMRLLLLSKPFCVSLNLEECTNMFHSSMEESNEVLNFILKTYANSKLKMIKVTTDNVPVLNFLKKIWTLIWNHQAIIQTGIGTFTEFSITM